MQQSEFLQYFVTGVRTAAPPQYQQFEARHQGSLVKLYFGDLGIHYELALRSDGLAELGLHFESDKTTNDRLLRFFSRQTFEIIAELGPQVEVEQWTKTWGRVHQTVAYASPSEHLLTISIERMAAMIRVLQPILEEA
jgi:hypothetical protein